MGRGFGWKKSEKKLYLKWLPVLLIINVYGDLVWPFAHFLKSRFWLDQLNHEGIKRDDQTKISIYCLLLMPYFLP